MEVKLTDKITIVAKEAPDPNFPGIWIDVKLTRKDGSKLDLAAALVELDGGIVKGRLWDYDNYENDPASTINLFDTKREVTDG